MPKKTNVVGLNGQPIKQRTGKADTTVKAIIKRLTELNNEGSIGIISISFVSKENDPGTLFYWNPDCDDKEFAELMLLLETERHSLIAGVCNSIEHSPIGDITE
jgi:hypothetical protein